jgi:hypothetical protein
MTATPPYLGFRFQVNWSDDDAVQLGFSAWNGMFGGAADMYEPIGGLEAAAAQLRGFPSDASDTRQITIGNFNRKCAGGGVSMRFYCIDGAGHSYVEATIDSNFQYGRVTQTVTLSMPVEASAVDAFVQQLHVAGAKRRGKAHLKTLSDPSEVLSNVDEDE